MNRQRESQSPVRQSSFGRGVLAAAALGVVTAALSRSASAQVECIPTAVGVFGLSGPPDWSDAGVTAHPIGQQLDDPRWNGSVRDDLPQGAGNPETAFRAVQDGAKLYVSLQTIVDPAPGHEIVGYDSVYIGFATHDGSTAELVQITLNNTTNANVADDPSDLIVTSFRYTTSTWSTALRPAWLEEPRIWTGTSTGTTGAMWGVNLRSILAIVYSDLGISGDAGPPPGSPIRMFYALNVFTHDSLSPTSVPEFWPPGAAFNLQNGGVPASNMQPSQWGTVLVGTTDPSCPTGVSLVPEHIGTMPISNAGIPSTTVQYGSDAGDAGNTFVAIMNYPDGSAPAIDSVKADFRIADWGSQIGDGGDWRSILPTGAPFPQNSDAVHPDRITWPCSEAPAAANACPQLPNPSAPPDQCLLVELSSTGGSTPIHFVSDSARRNLDFVHASRFSRVARISLNGLAPLAGGSGDRDVYLYVKTTNLPATAVGGSGQTKPGVEDAGPTPLADSPRGMDTKEGPTPAYEKTPFESLRNSSPTYEVHVYHDTGRIIDTGKGPTRVLEPQIPFAYLVEHAGQLDGWKHQLEGLGVVLELVSPDFYHLKIREGGSAVVRTTIEAVEPVPPQWWWLVLALVALVALVVLLRLFPRRRNG